MKHAIALLVSSALSLFASQAAADWTTRVRSQLAAGRPLVTRVVVALCSNDQVDCGSVVAGQPGRLATNLYWGAIFGARRFLDRKRSGWQRVELGAGPGPILERAVYRREVNGAPWGLLEQRIEQLVVLDAIHGADIDRAVAELWDGATHSGTVSFGTRTEAVSVMGYVGHNRMMDGLRLPAPRPSTRAVPSFVLACYSERYFAQPLGAAGSELLLGTTALMAPEGYVLDAVLKGIGAAASPAELRVRAGHAYAKWQRLSPGTGRSIFAKR